MAIKPILKMGTPSLLERSEEITKFACDELNELIQDMKDSMHAVNGIGLAAPQIGVNKRIVIFGFNGSPRYPLEKPVPFTILINPVITLLTEEMADNWEACLSVAA